MDISTTVEIEDPSFRGIAKAIRDYLHHEYANFVLGIDNEPPPMKLSAFSGKGVGFYRTSEDGRPDFSPQFMRYLERSEARQPDDVSLRFGVQELKTAMEAMKKAHPQWHAIVLDVDVHGMRAEDYSARTNVHISKVKRLRKKAIYFIYENLRLIPAHADRVPFKMGKLPA